MSYDIDRGEWTMTGHGSRGLSEIRRQRREIWRFARRQQERENRELVRYGDHELETRASTGECGGEEATQREDAELNVTNDNDNLCVADRMRENERDPAGHRLRIWRST